MTDHCWIRQTVLDLHVQFKQHVNTWFDIFGVNRIFRSSAKSCDLKFKQIGIDTSIGYDPLGMNVRIGQSVNAWVLIQNMRVSIPGKDIQVYCQFFCLQAGWVHTDSAVVSD